MTSNFSFRTASEALTHLSGVLTAVDTPEVGSRLGERTKELTHVQLELTQPWKREILTEGRRASLPAQIAETMWVLAGRDDVDWLSNYLPRAAEFSDDGKTWRGGYGPRLRAWGPNLVDQLDQVVRLLKKASLTRRAVIQIFDPTTDFIPGKDIPCNNWLHFLNRDGALDLHVATRSNDLWWGWSGINAFEWSALQEIVAGLVGVRPGKLVFSISSLHLYDRHWGRAAKVGSVDDNVTDEVPGSPRFNPAALLTPDVDGLDRMIERWFEVEAALRDALPDNSFEAMEPRVAAFPEPLLRGWLRVIGFHWSRDARWLGGSLSERLVSAAWLSPRRKTDLVVAPKPSPFIDYVSKLHADKDAAYGDSWCKRGELLSILPNIARKVDRLDSGKDTDDENATDTAIDLLVYLVKYHLWLNGNPEPHATAVPKALKEWEGSASGGGDGRINELLRVHRLVSGFNKLADQRIATAGKPHPKRVSNLIGDAFTVARHRWERDQEAKSSPSGLSHSLSWDLWKAGNARRRWNPEQ